MTNRGYICRVVSDVLTVQPILPPASAGTSSVEVSPRQPECGGSFLNKVCGVYSFIHLTTGMRYVGSSKDIGDRRRRHWAEARKGSHHCLHRAIRKFGEAAFGFEVLEICPPEVRFNREKHFIELYDCASVNGFNTRTDPTVGFDYEFSEATRARISAANMGRTHTVSVEARAKISAASKGNKHALGHICSPETRAKISSSNRGQKRSPEAYANMSAAQKGRKYSPENRLKMSAYRMGHAVYPETRAKIAAWHRGRKPTLETRLKISASLKGSKLSLETRAKISASLKGNTYNLGHKHTPETRAKMVASQRKRPDRQAYRLGVIWPTEKQKEMIL